MRNQEKTLAQRRINSVKVHLSFQTCRMDGESERVSSTPVWIQPSWQKPQYLTFDIDLSRINMPQLPGKLAIARVNFFGSGIADIDLPLDDPTCRILFRRIFPNTHVILGHMATLRLLIASTNKIV